MSPIFEITLKSIEVAENGYAVAIEGENFFLLLYSIQKKASLRLKQSKNWN